MGCRAVIVPGSDTWVQCRHCLISGAAQGLCWVLQMYAWAQVLHQGQRVSVVLELQALQVQWVEAATVVQA